MPSNKKHQQAAAAEPSPDGSAADPVVSDDTARVDLLESLEIGTPGLPPLPATLTGIDFAINRYYDPATIWKWSDLQRVDTSTLSPAQIAAGNRALLEIVVAEADHDKIDDILAVIADRSIPEARRIYAYLNLKAGLTDQWGNPLAL